MALKYVGWSIEGGQLINPVTHQPVDPPHQLWTKENALNTGIQNLPKAWQYPVVVTDPVVAQALAAHKVLVEPVSEPTTEAVALTQQEALTQEYLTLHNRYVQDDVKALVTRMETIKKFLQTVANETMDKDKPAIFTCPDGRLEFSERGKTTVIPDPLQLIANLEQKFGSEVAFSVVEIAITPLKKILSELELQQYAREDPGHRTLKNVVHLKK